MQTLIAWIVVVLLPAAALPWSLWLLASTGRRPDWPLTAALSLSLAYGGLTLLMFWTSLAGLPFDGVALTIGMQLLCAPGVVLWMRAGRPWPPQPRLNRWSGLAALLLAAVAAAILFNAAYWPFSRDDALGIYHAQAEAMAETRALLPLTGADSLYLTYPPLMPLAYAYTYRLSGWENEYLARLISALLALGSLLAAYALGREVDGRLTGALSALILALAPTFGRWASTGYVDLPAAFFVTLSAVFALRLWRSGAAADALLAGLCMGLAAWTKNATLIEVVALAVWLLAGPALHRFGLRAAAAGLLACALVAAPWYVRNWLGAGFLVPATAWTEDARPTLDMLLVLVTRPEIYALSGWLMLLGGLFTFARLGYAKSRPAAILLLLWTGPFFGAWWLLTSYDPRLLLPVAPLLAVMGGWGLASGWRVLPVRWQAAARAVATLLALALAALAIWSSVEFKDEILRNPLMDDAAKHALAARNRSPAP